MIDSWRNILALVVFLLTNLAVVFPFRVPVPVPALVVRFITNSLVHLRVLSPRKQSLKDHTVLSDGGDASKTLWFRFTVNFQTVPLMGVLLLLATGVLRGSDVRQGIVGTGGIHPLDIMALFISLAYLSISLDATGLLRFLAFWVARKGGSSGRRLYLLLYLFFFISGVVVGNDPVVLSGTAFLAYFTRVSGIVPPTAWIYAQFSAANIASAVLPPSNPTNLVLTGAFSISFISYTAHTILPALAAAVAVYPLLAYGLFSSNGLIPREIDLVELQQTSSLPGVVETPENPEVRDPPALGALTDKHGAIFGSVLLGITLIVLVGTSPLKVPVWEVTIPPALIMLARDVWHDRKRWTLGRRAVESLKDSAPRGDYSATFPASGVELEDFLNEPRIRDDPEKRQRRTISSIINYLQQDALPTLSTVVTRLPIALIPFAFCMFILVQGLTSKGWVEVFAGWWTAWIHVCSRAGSGLAIVGAIGGMLLVSTLLCNFCGTNIGTTILLARVLQDWLDTSASSDTIIDPRVRLGSIYALAIGTNFGAFTFSFSASLAGLLWREILRQKGIMVRQSQFAALNLPIICVAACTAAAVLVAEVYVVS